MKGWKNLTNRFTKKDFQTSELKQETEELEQKDKLKEIKEPLNRDGGQIAKPKVEEELLTQEHRDLIEEQNETIENLRREIYCLKVKMEPITNFNGKTDVCQKCVRLKLEMETEACQFAKLKEDVEFLKNLRKAEIDLKIAQVIDQNRSNFICMSGFNCRIQPPNKSNSTLPLLQAITSNIQDIIQKIIPNCDFSITNVKTKKKQDNVSVCFSETSDVSKIFSELEKHCKLPQNQSQNMSVTKLLLPATKVRLNILEAIGKRVQQTNKTQQNWKVQLEDSKPYLCLPQKGGTIFKYTFTDAVVMFKDLMRSDDLKEAKALCKHHRLAREDLTQFVLKL